MKSPIFDPDPSLYPDPTGRAARMIAFVQKLELWEGEFAGTPFRLHDFQRAIINRIYGPVAPDGSPVVRTAALWLPRGNAKTTLAAALALGHFFGPEREQGGQVVAAAADRENAGIAFNSAFQMVKVDRALLSRIRPQVSRKIMVHEGSRSTLKAISTEAYSKHGLNVSFLLADEVHAWPPTKARDLWKVVTDSMVKRRHPLSLIISTAGEGQGGLAYDLWEYSHKVATGEVEDPSFAAIIFAADPKLDWRDEAAWHSANPAIAAGFCSLAELRIKARRIEHFPGEVSDFRRFHLNQWVEGASDPWIDLALYDTAEPMTDPEALVGASCYVGVDLSSVEDLTAVVAVFPDGEGGYDVLAMFFLPEAGLAKKAERDRADYLRWRDDGFLRVTEGNRVDYAVVMAYVIELARIYDLLEVPIDRWNSTAVNTGLQDEGINVVEFGQGYASMAAPVKELKRAILGGQFRHGGNPVLRMCFGNVVATRDDAENEKFTKEKSRGRIDGAVGAAMAVGRALAGDGGLSVYAIDRPDGFLII